MRKVFSAIRRLHHAVRSGAYSAYLRLAYPGIAIPPAVRFGRAVRLRTFDGGSIAIATGAYIDDGTLIEACGGQLQIGAHSRIGRGSVIICSDRISIGAGTLIAEYVTIRDQDHRHGGEDGLDAQGLVTAPIVIGANVWLGAKVTVTRGVHIADRVVVGANAVVTRGIAERGVYGGVPAKRLG